MKKKGNVLLKFIDCFFGILLVAVRVVVQLIVYLPLLIVFPLKRIGYKNYANLKTGKILALNHLSNFDAIISALFFPFAKILAKKELGKNWFLRWFFKWLNVILVDRNNPELSTIKKVSGELKKGKTVVIFPEGTRNKKQPHKLLPLKTGVVFFARTANCPIIPASILKKSKPFVLNRMKIGEQIIIKDRSKEGLVSETEKLAIIMQSLHNDLLKKYEPKEYAKLDSETKSINLGLIHEETTNIE